SFNCTPGNEKNLIDATMKVLAKVKEIGANETDLTKVKETQRQERIKNLEQNNFWSNTLLYAFQSKINPELILMKNYEPFINSLTADDIKSAAKQYLDEKSMIKIVADPKPEVIKP
ncbi:MAG TPA: hypothetical protein PKM86_10565, partial [Saprospiraceae bacterium]|nr:hypothetical protein [Saprospiraceae bacterium]